MRLYQTGNKTYLENEDNYRENAFSVSAYRIVSGVTKELVILFIFVCFIKKSNLAIFYNTFYLICIY